MKAWILFDDEGHPQFIDGELNESEFKTWYSNQINAGWTAELCEISRALAEGEERSGQ